MSYFNSDLAFHTPYFSREKPPKKPTFAASENARCIRAGGILNYEEYPQLLHHRTY